MKRFMVDAEGWYVCPSCQGRVSRALETALEPSRHASGCARIAAGRLPALNVIIIRENLWFCLDCALAITSGDYPDGARFREVDEAIARLGGYASPAFADDGSDRESFSVRPCDCCRSRLAGARHRFSVLA